MTTRDTSSPTSTSDCENAAHAREAEGMPPTAENQPESDTAGIAGGISDHAEHSEPAKNQASGDERTGDSMSPLTPSGWSPAFPGQRAPFTPGHTLSTTHGAYSPRKVDPLAEELVEHVLTDSTLTFLHAPAYRPALWAWGRAEAQAQLLTEYLATRVEASVASKRSSAAYRELHRAETRAASLRSQLGLTPLSRARLGKDVAQGKQADAAAELTRMREEHEARSTRGRHDNDEHGDKQA